VSTVAAGENGLGTVETSSGPLRCILPVGARPGQDVTIVVRPEDIHLCEAPSDHDNTVEGEVAAIVYMGETLDCQVALGHDTIRLRLHPSSPVECGQSIRLAMYGRACRALAN
jgi:iron(III) transport system ATP-binding protein